VRHNWQPILTRLQSYQLGREGNQCGTLASKMSRQRYPFVNTSQVSGRVGATLCRTSPVLEREGVLRRLELMVAAGSALIFDIHYRPCSKHGLERSSNSEPNSNQTIGESRRKLGLHSIPYRRLGVDPSKASISTDFACRIRA
jgi:hypothetical protein